jgi:hypothetical protein
MVSRQQPINQGEYEMANSKSLIAYFSRKGNNYVGGSIVNLPIINTEAVAGKVQKLTGSDIFQIKILKSYPDDYTEATNVAQEEKRKMPDLSLRRKSKIWVLMM